MNYTKPRSPHSTPNAIEQWVNESRLEKIPWYILLWVSQEAKLLTWQGARGRLNIKTIRKRRGTLVLNYNSWNPSAFNVLAGWSTRWCQGPWRSRTKNEHDLLLDRLLGWTGYSSAGWSDGVRVLTKVPTRLKGRLLPSRLPTFSLHPVGDSRRGTSPTKITHKLHVYAMIVENRNNKSIKLCSSHEENTTTHIHKHITANYQNSTNQNNWIE